MGSITTSTAPSSSSLLTTIATQLHLSPTLEINELVHSVRARGQKVVHLGFGEATFPIQADVLVAHEQHSRSTSYMPVAGLLSLRQAIAKYNERRLGVQIAAEQVVVAPGSKPLLFALFDILRGDVLLPRPSWVSYEPQVKHAGKRLFWVETDEHDRHTITYEALREAYDGAVKGGADPRIMLINSPSNPTGRVFSEDVVETITAFCHEKAITLISDEIYSDLCYDPKAISVSAYKTACKKDPNGTKASVIMTAGLSKTYSAGGWRVGYAIFPSSSTGLSIQQSTLAYASECWSAASAPAQHASVVAFSTSPELDVYRRRAAELHRYCTTRLYEALVKLGLDVAEPQGSFYVYPSFHPFTKQLDKIGVRTSKELSKWLIESCGVAALPGEAFGEVDDGLRGGRFRLRMATSYLYFANETERYGMGYELLNKGTKGIELPLLEEAIATLGKAVEKLRLVQI